MWNLLGFLLIGSLFCFQIHFSQTNSSILAYYFEPCRVEVCSANFELLLRFVHSFTSSMQLGKLNTSSISHLPPTPQKKNSTYNDIECSTCSKVQILLNSRFQGIKKNHCVSQKRSKQAQPDPFNKRPNFYPTLTCDLHFVEIKPRIDMGPEVRLPNKASTLTDKMP